MIRPEDLHFSTEDVDNTLPGVVRDRRFRGALTGFVVETEAAGLLEVIGGVDGPGVGERVRVGPRPGVRAHLFAGAG